LIIGLLVKKGLAPHTLGFRTRTNDHPEHVADEKWYVVAWRWHSARSCTKRVLVWFRALVTLPPRAFVPSNRWKGRRRAAFWRKLGFTNLVLARKARWKGHPRKGKRAAELDTPFKLPN
jgi:hypothetical protein